MATISLCMIVKNEEEVLARCLQSVASAVDEMIIVDTGSTDGTKKIARMFTDRVYDFDWIDDFAAARNFSFSKATMDYCMWLDADDILMESDCLALMTLKADLTCDVVMMRYHTAFNEKGEPAFSYYRERLLRRTSNFRWEGAVHEAITPKGEVLYSEIAVTHRKEKTADPHRNLRIYEKELSAGKSLSPRDQFYYARELTYHGRDRDAAAVLENMLKSKDGWLENRLEACRLLSKCWQRLGEEERSVSALLYGFSLTAPRAELCCDLGDRFLAKEDYPAAIFWYESALSRPRQDKLGGFVLPDRYGVYPALQICVCYWQMGEEEQAIAWNEKAAVFDPYHPAVAHNRQYFAEKNRPL